MDQPQTSRIPVWRCPNCGQTHFGDPPPDTCDFCQDMTTWQPVISAAPIPARRVRRPQPPHADPPYTQMRLFDDEG